MDGFLATLWVLRILFLALLYLFLFRLGMRTPLGAALAIDIGLILVLMRIPTGRDRLPMACLALALGLLECLSALLRSFGLLLGLLVELLLALLPFLLAGGRGRRRCRLRRSGPARLGAGLIRRCPPRPVREQQARTERYDGDDGDHHEGTARRGGHRLILLQHD